MKRVTTKKLFGVFQEETDSDWVAGLKRSPHTAITAAPEAGCVPALSVKRSSLTPVREISPEIHCSEKGHDQRSLSRARSVSNRDEDDEMPRRKRRHHSSQTGSTNSTAGSMIPGNAIQESSSYGLARSMKGQNDQKNNMSKTDRSLPQDAHVNSSYT
jgi:hypothetical protein